MPKVNYGKAFEEKFKSDISKIDGVSVLRLPDQFNGYKNSSNISDFIVYKFPVIIYLELKCRYGNTFSINDLTQYDRLILEKGKKGVFPLVIVWFIDHDKVIAFPIETIEQMKKEGLKSINIKTYNNYDCLEIPSIRKRVFMDSDYRYLFEYLENKITEVN